MKILAVFAALMFLVMGCSGQTRKDYYEAVEVSSVAHSQTQIARFEALSLIAGKDGDSASKVAAVMAIALLRQTTIQPQYIESEALSYTKALAAPLTGVAALLIQADLSNQTNKQNNKTARAQIDASSAEQTALMDAFGSRGAGAGLTTDLAIGGIIDIADSAITGAGDQAADNNDLIDSLAITLQPVVPVVEIVPLVEIVPVEIVPIANPNP